MKTVAIWGSTGVIGKKAFKIAMNSGYRIVAIIGNKNHKLLMEQAKLAKPVLLIKTHTKWFKIYCRQMKLKF